MEKELELSVGINPKEPLNNAYGLFISIDGPTMNVIKDTMSLNAKCKVEVAVKFCNEIKDFTLAEFLEKLGFDLNLITKKEA